jgi:hypothetical protein
VNITLIWPAFLALLFGGASLLGISATFLRAYYVIVDAKIHLKGFFTVSD